MIEPTPSLASQLLQRFGDSKKGVIHLEHPLFFDPPDLRYRTARIGLPNRSSSVAWALRGFWLPVGVLRM